jgi:peptidoglycan/LPS O-acetylase OafA/YrhL
LSHAKATRGFPVHIGEFLGWFDLGGLGVRVFFVISGFLITHLLRKEIEHNGLLSLRGFYFRRTLRIFPAYYAFIGCMMVAAGAGVVGFAPGDLRAAFTYTMNYHWSPGWNLGHSWSLAVEEQFYLVWPLTIVLAGMRRSLRLALFVVLIEPVVRFLLLLPEGAVSGISTRFETVADALATGCALALARQYLWESPRYRTFLRSRWVLTLPCAVILLSAIPVLAVRDTWGASHFFVGVHNLVGITTMNVTIAVTLDWAIRHHKGVAGGVLNSKPLVYVGGLSYSLYLWQQPFLGPPTLGGSMVFPANVVAAIGVAVLSHHLIERPVLRVRGRLEQRWSVRRPLTAAYVHNEP